MEVENIDGTSSNDRLYEELAGVAKAFANPKRFRLLGLLAQGERCVDALAMSAAMGVTTVSAHLQTLKSTGLVTSRRSGTHVFYRLAGDDVAAAFVAVRDLAIARSPVVAEALREVFGDDRDPAIAPVGRDELMTRARRNVAVVDVRPDDEFLAGHLPGAVSIPLEHLEERLDDLDDRLEIVAYCRGAHCVMADDAVRIAAAHGRGARRLEGGYIEWCSEARPIEASA